MTVSVLRCLSALSRRREAMSRWGSYVTVIGSHRCSSSFVRVVTDSKRYEGSCGPLQFAGGVVTARWSGAGR